MRRLARLAALSFLPLSLAAATPVVERLPYDSYLDDIFSVRISQPGLDFLAQILADGLEQPTLNQQIVGALEGQAFTVLVPQLGDYAYIVIDYAPGDAGEELDGFRYSDVDVEISTAPFVGALRPEGGVLYPAIALNRFYGSVVSNTNNLPELHVRVYYPSGNPVPILAVAYGKLIATGILRPYVGNGTLSVMVEDFQTRLEEFNIAWVATAGATPTVLDALGELLITEARKELEDALSDVLMSGLNDILFDRDKDGAADKLLDLREIFLSINDWLDTDFDFVMDPILQTNPTPPTTAFLRTSGSMFLQTPGDCVGPDVDAGFLYSRLEADGITGHDPPPLAEEAPTSGETAQFAISISDDFLNQLAFNAYRTGLACLFFDPTAPGMPSDVTSLLTTDSLAALVGTWIKDLAPGAPIGFRLRMSEAPSMRVPSEGEIHLRAVLPRVEVDLLVKMEERWVRLMGASAALDLGVGVRSLSLTGDQLADVVVDIDVDSSLRFAELVPDRADELATLLPTALSLAESAVADLAAAPAGDLTTCVDGLDISLFEAGPVAPDLLGDFAHYLGIWLSLEGTTDLALLFECVLGEPLVEAPSVAAPVVLPAFGASGHDAAALVGQPVQTWRFAPGFRHVGGAVVPAMPLGTRRWQWQGDDGRWHEALLVGGVAEPLPQVSRAGDAWRVDVDAAAGLPVPSPSLLLVDGRGRTLARSAGTQAVFADHQDAVAVRYRDGWGRQGEATLPGRESGGGCAAVVDGRPGAGALAGWLPLLVALGLLRRRRRAV
jgi:hypothetical protein